MSQLSIARIYRSADRFTEAFALVASMMRDEASYICNSCGEEIVIPVDVSAGMNQRFVEDCPVCCRPNVIHVEIDERGDVRARGELE